MAKHDRMTSYCSSHHIDANGVGHVICHETQIVTYDVNQVTLNAGDYLTPKTKNDMNRASRELRLGFTVYQKNWNWYVTTKRDTINGIALPTPFKNGMTFLRS